MSDTTSSPTEQQNKIPEEELHFELVDYSPDSNQALHELLIAKFHALCEIEFPNPNEMELLDVWKKVCKSKDANFPYRLYFVVVFQKNRKPTTFSSLKKEENDDEEEEKEGQEEKTSKHCEEEKCQEEFQILGGVQIEYYEFSNTGLLPYVVVAKEARGLGLCNKLVKNAYSQLQQVALKFSSKPLEELFIEVSQASESRNDGCLYHSLEAALMRQQIWEKVGFLGLNFSYYHPGYLKNSKHQLTVYRGPPNLFSSEEERKQKTVLTVSKKTVLTFIFKMFFGILIQEEEDDEKEKVVALVEKEMKEQFGIENLDAIMKISEDEQIPICAWL